MGVLYTGAGVSAAMTASTAGAFLVFSLLYTPCIAAIASIRREMGGKWAVAVIVWQCAVAWGVTAVFRLIMLLFGAA